MKTLKRANKLFAVLSSVLMLIQPVLPAFSLVRTPVFAQSADPTPTDTVTPTPEPTVVPTDTQTPTDTITPTPTEEVTPTAEVTPTDVPTVTETPTPEATPTDTITPDATETPTITTTEPPHETSPPAENGDLLPEAASTVAPTSTPEATPTVTPTPTETGHLETSVLKNVQASSVDLDSIDLSSATLTTNQPKYYPGDTVLISGTSFIANKGYKLTITSADGFLFEDGIKASDEGNIVYAYQLPEITRPQYTASILNGQKTIASVTFADPAKPSTNLDQCANGGVGDAPIVCSGSAWQNGNLNGSQAHYLEGQTVPYRAVFDNLVLGSSYTVTLQWDTTKSGKHAIDYLRTYNTTETTADPCSGVVGCSGSGSTFAIPSDPNVSGGGVTQAAGNFTMFNGTITSAPSYTLSGTYAGDSSTSIVVTFTSTINGSGVLAWGGHIATRQDWGANNSAISISGSPYHMRVIDFTCSDVSNCSSGNQDRSLSADAVVFPASITIVKDAVPNSSQDFAFTTVGLSNFSLDDDADATLSNTQVFSVTSFTTDTQHGHTTNNGTVQKTITETGASGWALTNLVCSEDKTQDSTSSVGTLTAILNVQEGENLTCTFTNSLQSAHLTLVKTVTNDNGGSAVATNWTLAASGPTSISGTSGSGAVTNAPVDGGTYTLSENSGPSGYAAGNWSCVTNNNAPIVGSSITLAAGDNATCTINNDDVQPKLTVTKVVVNDNGGIKVVSDFPLFVGATGVTSGVQNGFNAGSYVVSETNQTGYTGTISGACDANGNVTLAAGDNKTCTITNNDNAPALHLRKTITNDNGGAALATAWTLTATGTVGSPTNLSGSTPVDSGLGFKADTYALAETGGPTGYTAGAWSCVGGTMGDATHVTVALGESATCTINNDDVAPTLKLVKVVTTNDGGTAVAGNWNLTATGTGGFTDAGDSNAFHTVNANVSYTLSESGPTGYTPSAWSCDGGTQSTNHITLGVGQNVTCSITNDDQPATLTLVKTLTKDNGGTAVVTDWTLNASGPTPISGVTGTAAVTSAAVSAGTYTLSETSGPAGYTAGSWSCVKNNDAPVLGSSITLANGDSATCTINNDDIAPQLIIIKHVINDNGGTASAADFTLDAGGINDSPDNFAGAENPGTTVTLDAGAYNVTESGPSGYAASYSVDCAGTIAVGETKTCTVTNDDISPQLTVIKHVVNDNGGQATASQFTMNVTATNVSDDSFPGAENPGTTVTLDAGAYTVDESPFFGYSKSLSADCSGSIAVGQTKTCTITNDDVAPTLKLVKTVNNDNGGNNIVSDFTGRINGNIVTWDVAQTLPVGTYTASEDNPGPGYTASAWGGNCNEQGSVTLNPGDNKVCTIVNDDVAPTITLIKEVINDNGGTAGVNDFGLTVGGNSVTSGQTVVVAANTPIAINETDLTGYEFVSLTGEGCPTTLGGTATLTEGANITCTITNDDIAPSLHLRKTVTNDNGGEASETDWTLSATGTVGSPTNLSGSTPVDSGSDFKADTYALAESGGPSGYTPGAWSCDGGTMGDATHVTVGLGESATCTINNDDVAPHLIVIKHVINNNGGSALAGDFTMNVDATNVSPQSSFAGAEDPGTDVTLDAGDYSVSENLLPGYAATYSADCEGTIAVGETKTCTITNDDNYSKIIVTKFRDDNGNGTQDEGESVLPNWEMNLASEGGTMHATTDVNGQAIFDLLLSDFYTLSETEQPGYQFTGIECPSLDSSSEVNSMDIELGTKTTVTCKVGNQQQNPILTISKTVTNTDGSPITDKAPGDAVLFTLTVINTQSPAYDVHVTDLPSAGFTYRAGSWSAKLNGVPVSVPEPSYHSPGVWTLGTMNVDATYELSYIADISGDQKPGLYKDLAWADGCKTDAPCSVGDSMSVLAEAVNPGFIDTNYVGTEVNVVKDQQNGATLNPQTGEVLGASTELPATGADSVWLTLAALLFVFGIGLIAAGKFARRHYV